MESAKLTAEQLAKIRGITPRLAAELSARGIDTITKLKAQTLPIDTQMALKYPLCLQIKREDAKKMIKKLPPSLIPVGSFRRRMPIMKDLDFITISSLESADKALIKYSKANKFIIHEIFRSGETRRTYVVEFPRMKCRFILLDLSKTTRSELPYAMLHHTGNFEFNIRSRAQAKRLGYKLNQYGLFRLSDNKNIKLKSEREILEKIGVTYIPPWKRV